MKDTIKQLSCEPSCGFMIQDHDRGELVDLVMQHIASSHLEMNITEEELGERIQEVLLV